MLTVDRPESEAVTAATTPEPTTPEPPPPTSGWSFERRASLSFKVLALFAAAVMAVVLPSALGGSASTIVTLLTTAGGTVLVGLLLVTAVGLDRRRGWAVGAARPMLVLMVLTGFGGALLAIGQGRLNVPIDALLATWALFGTPDARPAPAMGSRGWATIAVYLAVAVVLDGAQPVFGPGGLLDVKREDLVASVSADCGPAGGGPPQAIDVAYEWSWKRTSLVPDGFDMIVVTWSGLDEAGQQLYIFSNAPDVGGTGIYPGTSSGPSAAMAQEVEHLAGGSWEWGIELGEQRLAPGRIQVQLLRTSPDAPPKAAGPLSIQVSYIHQGVWQDVTRATGCEW